MCGSDSTKNPEGEKTPLPPDPVPPPPDSVPLPSGSVSSRDSVQVVNVYSGKASESEKDGIPAWLKEKFEEFKKSLTGGGDHGGRGQKASWQPLVSNSVLILILLVVVGQAAFQDFRPPTEERKDDNADRQLLMSMLTMMAARNQATVMAAPPAQGDASPKIVVMPVSLPSAPPSPATTAPSGTFQFKPLQIEVKTTTPAVSQEPTAPQPIEPPSANPIMITAWLDSDNKCQKKQTDDKRPLIYFAFVNNGTSAIWVKSIEGPNFGTVSDKAFADLKPTEGGTNPQQKVIYPGQTYTRTANCKESNLSRKAPGFASIGIQYRLKQDAKQVFVERAEFYVVPPTAPTRVGGFSGITDSN